MTIRLINVPGRIENTVILPSVETQDRPIFPMLDTGLASMTWPISEVSASSFFRTTSSVTTVEFKTLEETTPRQRLEGQQAEIIQRALAFRSEYGDPVSVVADLLDELVGDQGERWEQIVDEAYG